MLPKSIDWNKDEKRHDGGAVEALKHFPQAAESTAEIRSAQSKKPPKVPPKSPPCLRRGASRSAQSKKPPESTAELPTMPSAQ